MSDWKIKLNAELNTKNINSQIETLKKQLSNSKIIADIDTKSLIEKLNNLQVNLNNVKVSDQAINNMVSQINNALKNINVQISNMDTTKIVNQSRQVGQQIGQNIQNGINSSTSSKSINIIEQIKRSLNEINTKGNKLGFTINDKEIESVANKIRDVVKQIDTLNVKESNNGKITISTTGLDKFGSKIKLTQTAIKDLESDTLKFTEAISSISDNGMSKQFERISSKADSLSIKLEKLKSSYSDLNSSRPIKDENNLASLESQYNKILESIQNVRNADNSTFSSMVSNAEKEISVLESMVSQFRNAENVATKMKGMDFSSALEIARNNLAKFKIEASNFSQMNTTVKELESSITKVGDASSLNKFTDQLRVAKSELQAVKKESSQFVNEQRRLSMANTIEAWNQKNTAASKTAIQANEQYIASLRDLNTQMSKVQFNNIQTSFKQTENAMRGMSKLGLALKDQWKQAVSSFTVWLSASTAVMKVISETRQAFSELKEIDTLLTEISKTNWNLTSNDLENIGSNSFGVASKYGKTATDYLSGVKDMSRAGYTNSEAMAELSVAAQGAGDMTAEVANKMVIATDKAYKMNGSVEQLTKTLDGVNWICDNNAVNMTELSEGMSIVASTAASMGVDVDQLTAALGTMAAVTQQSGSEVARAFKAILLNVKQVSDADENIDADGLTKYEKACNALGVSLKETKDGVLQTRDAMEVLGDLSKAYSKLDTNDIRRTNLLNSVGGKLRSTQLDALLRNWDTYKTMLQQFENGAGTMAVEGEKTASSWEGSLNKLSNTFTSTINNIANSKGIITIVNSMNTVLDLINKITSALGSMGSIGAITGLIAAFKGNGIVKVVDGQLNVAGKSLDVWKNKVQDTVNTLQNSITATGNNISSITSGGQSATWSYSDKQKTHTTTTTPLKEENLALADNIRLQNERVKAQNAERSSESSAIAMSQKRVTEMNRVSVETAKAQKETQQFLNTYTQSDEFLNQQTKNLETQANGYQAINTQITQHASSVKESANVASDAIKKETEAIKESQEVVRNWNDQSFNASYFNGSNNTTSEEIKQKNESMQRINNSSVANIMAHDSNYIEEANGQMAMYNASLEEQNALAAQRTLILTEEADGQIALTTASEANLQVNQQATQSLSSQTAARYAVIEAQNKEFLGNVKEKLVKTGVIEATDELTISKLRSIAASESAGAAISQETLGLLGLEGQAQKTSLAMKGLSIGLNMIATMAIFELISGVINTFKDLINTQKDVSNSAKEFGDDFSSSTKDIDDYQSKIKELHETIDNSSSSYEDVKKAREDLLSIQNEMIDKYGEEAESISTITDAVNNQTEAFDKLKQAKYLDTKNDFNASGKGFGTWIRKNVFQKSNFDVMKDTMENTIVEIPNSSHSKELKDMIRKVGIQVVDGNTGGVNYGLQGNLEDIYNTLLNIQSLADTLGEDDFSQDIGKKISEVKELLKKNKEMYNAYVEYEKVQNNPEYSNIYDKLEKSYKKYKDATQSGKNSDIEKQKEEYAKLFEESTKNIDDKSVINYFKNLYPELKNEVNSWDFELNFKSKKNKDMKDDIQKAVDAFSDSDAIKNFNSRTATEDQKNAYAILSEYASQYNIAVDELINSLIELGTIESQNKKEAEKKLLPGDITGAGASAQIAKYSAPTKIDPTVTKNWIDSLSEKELGMVNTNKFTEALKIRQELFDYASNSAQLYVDALNDVKEATDNTAQSATDFSELKDQTTSFLSGISSIKELISSTQTGKSVSFSDFSSDDLVDYRSALEYVNGSMQVNAEKVNELIKAKAQEQIAINKTNKELDQAQYMKNAEKIDELREKLKNYSDAEDENRQKIQDKIETLSQENDTLSQNCDMYDLMTSSIEETTSAYQNWLNAQNASESGDMFKDTINALTEIDNVLNNTDSEDYGKIGTKKYAAAVDFILPDSVDSEDEQKVNEYLNSIDNLFEHDENGKKAGLNIEKFCQQAVDKGLMVLDESTQEFKVAGGKTMEDFASGMNLSIDVVKSVFGNLEDYGANFDWGDEAIKSFGDGIVKCEKQANELREQLDTLKKQKELGIEVDDGKFKETVQKLAEVKREKKDLEKKSAVNIEAYVKNSESIKKAKDDVSSLKETVKNSKDQKFKVEAQTKLEDAKKKLKDLEAEKDKLQKPTKVEIQIYEDDLDKKIKATKKKLADYKNNPASVKADMSDDEFNKKYKELQEKLNKLKKKKASFTTELKGKDKVDANLQKIQDFNINDKKFEVDANIEKARKAIDEVNNWKLQPKTLNIVTAGEDATKNNASKSGKANANGDPKVTLSRRTLVGELGQEMVVNPKSGKWYTVGDNGAEFVDIPKGSIVFNHEQTKDLLNNGYVSSRASALAKGNAFVSGNAMVTGGIKVSSTKKSSTYWQKKRDEEEKKKEKSSSSSNGSNRSSSSSSGTQKEEKTALEKFQDWFSSLFDWIEIKLERQTDKINSYIKYAENELDSKKYTNAVSGYTNAVESTTEQMNNETAARDRYKRQADDVLSRAVSAGLVSNEGANTIAVQVRDGVIDIQEYSDELKEVIKDYQEWYEKSKSANDSIQELHNNIRTYIKDIKDVRDSQRQAKLDNIDNMNTIGASGLDNSISSKNNILKYSNKIAAQKDKAYANETKQLSKDLSKIGNKTSSVLSSVGTSDAQYAKALSEAKKAIKAKKKISSSVLNVLKRYSSTAYENAYAYNLSVDNLESARLEKAINYAQQSNERYANKISIFGNRNTKSTDRISLLNSKIDNKNSTKTKTKLLSAKSSEYTNILDNDNAQVNVFSNDVSKYTKNINKKGSVKGSSYKSASNKAKKAVSKCITSIRKAVKSKKPIVASLLSSLAKYYSQGYVTNGFYNSCINYNNALDSRNQAIAQREIDKQTIIQEKQSVVEQKNQIIKDSYSEKDTKINNKKDLLSAKVENATNSKDKNKLLTSVAKQYDNIVKNDNSEIKDYSSKVQKNSKTIKTITAGTKSYRKLNKKAQNPIKNVVKKIKNLVGSKKEISDSLMDKISDYYTKGYITSGFYSAVISYNESFQYKEEAELQKEIDEQNAISEKASIGTKKIQTIEQDYTNELTKNSNKSQRLQASQNYKTTKGMTLNKNDYEALIANSQTDEEIYAREYQSLVKQIQDNVVSGLWSVDSQEYKDATNSLDDIIIKIDECKVSQEKWNNSIIQLPYQELDKALAKLDAIKDNYDSVLSIDKVKGIIQTADQYTQQIDNLTNQMDKTIEKRNQKLSDYQKALTNPDGVYGGKDADTLYTEYKKLDTEVNNLTKDIIEKNNALANLPIDTLERAVELVESMRSDYESLVALDKTRGKDQTVEQYKKLIEYDTSDVQNYTKLKEEAINKYNQALNSFDGAADGKNAEDWQKKINEYDKQINNAKKNIIESTNAIIQLPYDDIERALTLLDKKKSSSDSLWSVNEAKGIEKAYEDYKNDIIQVNEEIDKNLEAKNKKWEDYQKALEDPDKVYGGKKAEELLGEYYDYDTKINTLRKDIVDTNNSMAKIPYNALEKELDLLGEITSNYQSLLDIQEAKGIIQNKDQYLKQIEQNNDKIDKYQSLKNQAWEDYRKALANPDGVYGGQNANEYLKNFYNYDTQINNITKDIVKLSNEMLNIPFDKIAKEIDSISTSRDKFESVLSIKEVEGITKTIQDYQKEMAYNDEEISKYQKQKELQQEYYNLANNNSDRVYDGKSAEEWNNEIEKTDTTINNLISDTKKLNNEMLNAPFEKIEKTLDLIQDIQSNLESILSLNETKGLSLTKNDYIQQIAYDNKQITQYTKERELAWQDYQKALSDKNSVFGGKTSDEWLSEFYKYDTQINNLKKDITEKNNSIAQIPYDNIDKAIDKLSAFSDYYSSAFDLKSKKGSDLTESDYLGKMAQNTKMITEYTERQKQAYEDYQKALFNKDGVYGGKTVEEWQKAYYEAGTQINNLKSENEELKDSLRDDVYWRVFERAHDSAQRFSDMLSSVSNLIDDDMMFDKDGKLTDFGVAKIANTTSQYETARKEVKNYSNDIQNLNDLYASGYYTQDEYNSKLAELQKSLLDSASNMKSYINDIKNTYKDMEQSEMDNLFKLIDLRNEALNSKKSYYEYDKTLKDKNKDIQSLQAQMDALEGIQTAEAKAKRASLQADLKDKQDELNDTINDHMLELSQNSLDELKTTLQDSFDDRWDDISSSLTEMIKLMGTANELTENSTSVVQTTLDSIFKAYGINSSITGIKGFASGTKSVNRNRMAWTNENGQEMIIRKSDGAILTPLKQGDIIPNANLSSNLFEWGKMNPQNFMNDLTKIATIPVLKENNGNVEITNHYDSLLNVEGNVDKNVLPELKEILKQSYEYTTKEIARDARKNGIKI